MERRLSRSEHVGVCHCFIILFLLMRLEQLLGLLLTLLITIDIKQRLLGIILLAMEDKPPRALRKPPDDQEEQGGIHLHGHNGRPPRPLARLAQRVSHGNVYGESHIEPKDVHLKLLRQRLAPRAVAAQLGAEHRDHGVDAANTQPHDDPPDPEHVNRVGRPPSEAGDKHDQVPQAGGCQAGEYGLLSAVVVGKPGEEHRAEGAAQVVDGHEDANHGILGANSHGL